MAIVGDRRKRFQNEIDKLEAQQDIAAKMVCIQLEYIQMQEFVVEFEFSI